MASWMALLGSFLRAVFARESLPPAAAAPPSVSRRSALSLLFAPEPLPEDPPAPAQPRGRWLAWLFAPERLDD
jgi:hypothetical protein